MNEIIVSLGIFFLSFFGFVIIKGFELLENRNNLLIVGLSYGLGVGLFSLQLYFYSKLGIPWKREYLIFPEIIITIFILFFRRKKFTFSRIELHHLELFEKLLAGGISLTVVYVLFEALLRPVSVWDAWATWLVEAKVFFIDGRITETALHTLPVFYPLLFPLLNTFMFILLGKVDDTAILLISFAFYLFLGLTFFSVLYRKYGVRYALFFTLLFVSTQNFIRHGGRIEAGIADLPLGYYIFSSVILLFEYLKKKNVKTFLLFMLFLGFTGLIKNEATPFVVLISLITLFYTHKERLYKHIFFFFIPFLLLLEWELFKRSHGLDKLYFAGHYVQASLSKTINACYGVFHELVTVKSWNLLWITYFYSLLFSRKANREIRMLNLIILFQLTIYLMLYIVTYGNNPESSIERLLVHIAPLAYFSVAILFYEVIAPSWIKVFFKKNKGRS